MSKEIENEVSGTVYLKVHEKYVREGIQRKDGAGEFNQVTLPKGTIVDGQDVGGYQFNPLFVQRPNKFENGELLMNDDGTPVKDETSPMREIPCIADREIWLKHYDRGTKETSEPIKVMPTDLDNSLKQAYKQYRELKKAESVEQDVPPAQSPQEVAKNARERAEKQNASKSAPTETKTKNANLTK